MNHLTHNTEYFRIIFWSLVFAIGIASVEAQTPKPVTSPAAATQSAGSGKTPPEVEKAMAMPESPEQVKALIEAAKEWAKKEPLPALTWVFQLPPTLSAKVVTPVALVNPPVSADWFIQQNEKGKGNLHGLLVGWAMADPSAATAWCMKAPKNVRDLAFFSVADGWVRKDRVAGSAWAMKLESPEDRLSAIRGAALLFGRGDVYGAIAWIKQLKPDELKFAAKVIAADWRLTKLKDQGATKVDAVKPWLDQLPLSDKEKEEVLNSPAPSSNGPNQK